jgi:hypothetical protein
MPGDARRRLAVAVLGLALLPSCGPERHVVSLDGIAQDYLFFAEVLSTDELASLTPGPTLATQPAPPPVFELSEDGRELYVITFDEDVARRLEPALDASRPEAVTLVDAAAPELSTLERRDFPLSETLSVYRLDRDAGAGARLVRTPLGATPLASLIRLRLARAPGCAPIGLTPLEPWHRTSLRPLAEHRLARGASAPLVALTAIDETRVLVPAGLEVYFLDARRPFDGARQPGAELPGDLWTLSDAPRELSVARGIVGSSTRSDGSLELLFVGGRDAADPDDREGRVWRAWGHAEGLFGPVETLVSEPGTFFRALAIEPDGPTVVLGDGGKVVQRSPRASDFEGRDRLPSIQPGERALALSALSNPRRPFVASTPGVLHVRNRGGREDWSSTPLQPSDQGPDSDWSSLVPVGATNRPHELLAFGDGGGVARFDGQVWSLEEGLVFPPAFRDCAAARGADGALVNRRDFVDAERAGAFVVFSVEGCDAVFWLRLEDRCVHAVHPPGKAPGSAEPSSGLLDPDGIGALEVVGSAALGWRVIALARDGAIWTATWGQP